MYILFDSLQLVRIRLFITRSENIFLAHSCRETYISFTFRHQANEEHYRYLAFAASTA